MTRRQRILPGLLVMLCAVAASDVLAQIYVCKDASGRTITADRPIPECANRAMRELDRNGMTRREIAAPLTAQQRHERELREEKQRIEAAAAEEQRLADRALTTRYRNETDIGLSRQRAIELLDEQMRIDTNALTREMKEMKAAQAATTTSPKTGGTPADRRRLDDATHAVERRLTAIEQRTADIEKEHQKYDLAVKRFRELQAAPEINAVKNPSR